MEIMSPPSSSSKASARSRRSRRRPAQEQYFSSYLAFGFHTTVCLGVFFAFYMLVLSCLSPLLQTTTDADLSSSSNGNGDSGNSGNGHAHAHKKKKKFTDLYQRRGEALKPVIDNLPGAEVIQKSLFQFRKKRGVTDASLMDKAVAEFKALRESKHHQFVEDAEAAGIHIQLAGHDPPGFMVLGMHRSGTSMLSGLLVTGLGYNVGGPLIGGAFDNVKGFFERVDAVLQNDEFMNLQHVWWSANVLNYKYEEAVEAKKSGKATFTNGKTALAFLNNPENAPYLQKDPRMCITLQTWLKLLDREPAIVFTYRHPLEVAQSLKKREQDFPLERGFRLWIIYNMRAIQNSANLCRVLTSNEAVLGNPLVEVQRISDELTARCRVPKPPRAITEGDVEKFVDPTLLHNTKLRKEEEKNNGKVISEREGCKIMEYHSDYPVDGDDYIREHALYMNAMKIYCDFQNGKAFEPEYPWPQLI